MQAYVERNGKGTLTVKGSRITLGSIVKLYREGESAETIREAYSTLSLPVVYGAIAYYLENQVEIDNELVSEGKKMERLRQDGADRNQDLRSRLLAAKAPAR